MINKSHLLEISILFTALIFSACSPAPAAQTPGIGQGSNPSGNGGNSAATTNSQTKTAIGILSMEGTSNAVTVDQAKTILPLYKAVKIMVSNSASSPAEVQALFDQIDENLNSSQKQAIEKIDTSPQNMRTLMSNLGIQAGNAQGAGGQRPSGGGGFRPGGGPGGPGGIPGGGGGTTAATPTSVVGQNNFRQQISPFLLTAVIDVLSKRAGVAVNTNTPVPGSTLEATPAAPAANSSVPSTAVPTP